MKPPAPLLTLLALLALVNPSRATETESRVASLFLSQDFINEQLKTHTKPGMLRDLSVRLDPEKNQFQLLGKLRVPVEELRALNLDANLGEFCFELTVKPEITKEGYLILEFPLSETFFYPAKSPNPQQDRVIVPVQLLSVALASARGYLAALSGDFSGFERRVQDLRERIKEVDRAIARAKKGPGRDSLNNERESLRLQLEAVPLERKQLEALSKQVEHILGFTGEKEINFNNELAAKKNALILKVKVSQLAPYLRGVELGGVRVIRDKVDGGGENYLVIDVNSLVLTPPPSGDAKSTRPGLDIAPSLIVKLDQALFSAEALVDAEKKKMGSHIRNLEIRLKEDGIHVSGGIPALWLFTISFETLIELKLTAPDVFEVRMRALEVAGIDLEFLEKAVLEAVQHRLDHTLRGICEFQYVDGKNGAPDALRVHVDPKSLVPAFPHLHLTGVDVRDRKFLLRVGHVREDG